VSASRRTIGEYMIYVLTILLFNGNVQYQQFESAHECNQALYRAMDDLFIKNIEMIECTEED